MEVGFFETIARDLSGKGQFRLILQPLAALIVFTRAVTNRIWGRVRGRHIRTPRTA